jgi:hypothetical protein
MFRLQLLYNVSVPRESVGSVCRTVAVWWQTARFDVIGVVRKPDECDRNSASPTDDGDVDTSMTLSP